MDLNGTLNIRPVVSGSLLPRFIGKNVSMHGKVLQSDKSGMFFEIETVDKHTVKVIMRKSLAEPVTGLVEVQGKVTGAKAITCDYYMVFPEDIAADYDPKIANDTVSLIHTMPYNPWLSEEA